MRSCGFAIAVSSIGLCACDPPDESLGVQRPAPEPVVDAAPANPPATTTNDGGAPPPVDASPYDGGYPDVPDAMATTAPTYVVTADTVLDAAHHLMWQRMEPGQYFDSPPTTYCAGLGLASFQDWRPATMAELTTLMIQQPECPLIDHEAFPAAMCDWYISSEYVDGDVYSALMLDFATGVTKNAKEAGGRVYSSRCVRTSL